jgi:mono/diheme cytochrome c family protein
MSSNGAPTFVANPIGVGFALIADHEEGDMVRFHSAAIGVLLLAASAQAQDEKMDTKMALSGERLFRTYCGACHGTMAKGDGPLAKDLKVAPADLTRLSEKNSGAFPFERVIETIDHGRNVRGHGSQDMPAWGDAFKSTAQSPDEPKRMMRELAHYLWSLQPK